MASGTDDLDNLIALLAKLPGLGPRSARRAVLHLIKKRSLVLIPLAEAMHRVGATARECLNCGNVGTTDICDICTSEKRAIGQICVVEDVADLWAMERSGVDAPYLCRGGACGQCETRVIDYSGNFIHRDHWLEDDEHASGEKIMPCVSRFEGKTLVLDR